MTDLPQIPLEEAQNLAISNIQQGNYRVAASVLEDILKLRKKDGQFLYLMGLCQYYLGNFSDSLGYFEKALKDKAAEAEWFCNYGIILTEAGDHKKALKIHDKAISKDPDYARTYWNKAHTHWLTGDFVQAEHFARIATQKDPQDADGWLNLGTALVKIGRKDEAVAAWERALEINPDFAYAWNNLGNVLRDMGQLKAAAEKCLKALAIDENYPEAQNNLGNALLDLDEPQESLMHYQKAIALKPDYIEAQNNLAINYMKLSRFEDAKTHARIALSYKDDYLDALISLSVAHRALGEMEDAEKAIQKALKLKPESAEVRIDLADVLYMQDRYAEAEIELRQAQEYDPGSPRVYLKLSEVLERGNKPQEALEAIDDAIGLNAEMPEAYLRKGQILLLMNKAEDAEAAFSHTLNLKADSAEAHLAFVDLYLSKGQKDKALESFEKAKALAPEFPTLYYMQSKLKRFTEDDPDFHQMVKMAEDVEKYGLDYASILHYALFSAYEDIGDYDAAFGHLMKANACKRETVPYDPKDQLQNFERLKDVYSADFLKSFEGLGDDSAVPVFILGMPRSGTTLTEQMLSAHPDIYGAGELLYIGTLDQEFGFLTAENAHKQGQRYIEQVRALDKEGTAKHITDKMPGNFAHLGKIVSILPKAKIIHTRRNPIDTCLSCFKQSFARGQYWSYNLEELGDYYNAYVGLMEHWAEVCPNAFIDCTYEDLVQDPEPKMRDLLSYVDLPWDDACLSPHKNKRTVLTASKTQVTQPIYTSSVQAWKRYERQLEPLIEKLENGAAKGLL